MISRDEWLAALNEAGLNQESDDEAITSTEFAGMFHVSRTTARDRLAALVRVGKATMTQKRTKDSAGRTVMCTAYRLVS